MQPDPTSRVPFATTGAKQFSGFTHPTVVSSVPGGDCTLVIPTVDGSELTVNAPSAEDLKSVVDTLNGGGCFTLTTASKQDLYVRKISDELFGVCKNPTGPPVLMESKDKQPLLKPTVVRGTIAKDTFDAKIVKLPDGTHAVTMQDLQEAEWARGILEEGGSLKIVSIDEVAAEPLQPPPPPPKRPQPPPPPPKREHASAGVPVGDVLSSKRLMSSDIEDPQVALTNGAREMLADVIRNAPKSHPIHRMTDAELASIVQAGPDEHGRIYLCGDLAISARWSNVSEMPPELAEKLGDDREKHNKDAKSFFEDEEKLRASRQKSCKDSGAARQKTRQNVEDALKKVGADTSLAKEIAENLPFKMPPVPFPDNEWLWTSYESYTEWATGPSGGIFAALLGKCRSPKSREWAMAFEEKARALRCSDSGCNQHKFELLGSAQEGTLSVKFCGSTEERDRDARMLAPALLYTTEFRYGAMVRREQEEIDMQRLSDDEKEALRNLRLHLSCRDLCVAVETQTLVGGMISAHFDKNDNGIDSELRRLVLNALVAQAVFGMATILCAQNHVSTHELEMYAAAVGGDADLSNDETWGPLALAWEDPVRSIVCPASNWAAVLPKPCGNKADLTREVAVDATGNFSSDPGAHEEEVGRVTSELNRANSRAFNALRAIGFRLQLEQPIAFSKAATKVVRMLSELFETKRDDRFVPDNLRQMLEKQCKEDVVASVSHNGQVGMPAEFSLKLKLAPPHCISMCVENASHLLGTREHVDACTGVNEYIVTSCLVTLFDDNMGILSGGPPISCEDSDLVLMGELSVPGFSEIRVPDLPSATRLLLATTRKGDDSGEASSPFMETVAVNAGLASIVKFVRSKLAVGSGDHDPRHCVSLWGYKVPYPDFYSSPSVALTLVAEGCLGLRNLGVRMQDMAPKMIFVSPMDVYTAGGELYTGYNFKCLGQSCTFPDPERMCLLAAFITVHLASIDAYRTRRLDDKNPIVCHSAHGLLNHLHRTVAVYAEWRNELLETQRGMNADRLQIEETKRAELEKVRRAEKTVCNRKKKARQKELRAEAEARQAQEAARAEAERQQAAFEAKLEDTCARLRSAILNVDAPWDKEKEPKRDPLERLRRVKKEAHEAFNDVAGLPELKEILDAAKEAIEQRKPKKERPARAPAASTPAPPPRPEEPPAAPKKNEQTGGKTSKHTPANLREKPTVAGARMDPAQAQSRLRALTDLACLEEDATPPPPPLPPPPLPPPPLPPDWIVCGITHEIFVDPVVTCTGQSYERAAMEQWIGLGKCIDPLTGEKMHSVELRPNYHLRSAAQDWVATRGREASA